MTKQRITTVLALVTGLAPLFFGLNFLLNPAGAPDGFGIEPWPSGNASGYFMVKGIRDVSTATIVFILLALGQRRALGWVVLTTAVIPLGDALAVVTHGGTLATAVGVHVSAAALVAVTAVLLLTESRDHHPAERIRTAAYPRPRASQTR
ncbi:hypothetical protein AR457_33390 [Streptomyces agglomeratus]|uniref:Small membrane hydrophobic protein n=1 Tax=Streptomyces agglomeratus TaxID=285458 RepID=A0A1E5PGF5_9ACTN|nr:DUF4267 domain-containing protein [Streptomyces agglomeratus]OEJ28623.1 hypothetical protein AS594_33275 [Streptomyces agglomeratus]OEJ37312.1 hypothetical protein BGK70_03280 [Streptomyces agglomeratus]OEJ48306.1 hypothetical protein AR457_33390 [Streptomyces agglomeratus]OEJ49857.1 hypothetical protein BGK72_02790 [Streptomyces agglomeratus]